MDADKMKAEQKKQGLFFIFPLGFWTLEYTVWECT